MGVSDEAYGGPERRQERNAELRAEMDKIAEKVGDSSELTEDDLSQLFELMHDLYWSGLVSSRSSELLEIVREEYADDLSPALLALLDDVLGRGGAV